MSLVDPDNPLVRLVQEDRRYPLDAYLFVLESLSFAQEKLGMGEESSAVDEAAPDGDRGSEQTPKGRVRRRRRRERHLTGQELCEAARLYALEQYGYLASVVLRSWGITRTDDFGELVYNMIGIGQMRKTRRDRREDFNGVYDFDEVLSRGFTFSVPEAQPESE
jgi:uncharacterized repeat protein (TIGR04138 family)